MRSSFKTTLPMAMAVLGPIVLGILFNPTGQVSAAEQPRDVSTTASAQVPEAPKTAIESRDARVAAQKRSSVRIKMFVWLYNGAEMGKELEKKVQVWLDLNPAIAITDIKQSFASTGGDRFELVLTIFYKEM